MSENLDDNSSQQLIGDIIRKAREKKNVSVKIVAQHTKISSTNLEALESNDLSSLPNKAYVKGYVKSCAKLLGLNESECLNILQANYDSLEKPIRVKEQKQQEKVKQEKENNELVFKMVGVIAVVVILVLVLSRQDSKPTSDEKVVAEEVQTQEAEKEEAANVTPVVISDNTPLKPEVEVTIEVTPVAIQTPVATPTPAPTPTPKVVKKEEKSEDEKDEKVDLRPITGTLYKFDSEISKDDIDEWLPSNFRAATVEGKQNVFINAIDGDTWLTYQADGGDIKKFILKQDQKLLITGEEILLFLGNYKVTRIFLNNKPLSISSRSGVKSLVFPQEKAAEHYYPLFIYNDDGSVVNSKTYNASRD